MPLRLVKLFLNALLTDVAPEHLKLLFMSYGLMLPGVRYYNDLYAIMYKHFRPIFENILKKIGIKLLTSIKGMGLGEMMKNLI